MVGEYILILGFIFSIVLSINVWVPLIRKLFTGKEYNHHED